MAATGALAVLVALSTMGSAAVPAGRVETALHLPKLSIQAPQTVPAAASPRLESNRAGIRLPDVDITGPVN